MNYVNYLRPCRTVYFYQCLRSRHFFKTAPAPEVCLSADSGSVQIWLASAPVKKERLRLQILRKKRQFEL